MDSWRPMSPDAALAALRLAVLGRNGERAARFADAAARAGASQAAVREVIGSARQDRQSETPPSLRFDDPVRWLAEALDLTLFEEADGVAIPRSRVAQRAIGVGFSGSLGAAIAQVTGVPDNDGELLLLLGRGRIEGHAHEVLVDEGGEGWRVVVMRTAQGTLRALVSRSTGAQSLALRRRAEESQILATVNHEVSNAMTAIGAIAKRALARPTDGEGLVAALQRIDSTSEACLVAARSTRHALSSQKREVEKVIDAGAVVDELVATLEPLAERTTVAIHRRIAPELEAAISAADLRSIVWNLVKNSIEASPMGGRVRVGASARDDLLRIVVDDEGPGMSAETRDRAFDSYYTTKDSGMGLGLPLVKTIIDRLEGTLLLETEPGRGCRFVIELPRRLPEQGAPSQHSGVRQRNIFDGLQAVVLSEDESLMPLRALTLQGAEVRQIVTEEEALELQGTFGLAIVDAEFAGGHGETIAEALRLRGVFERVVLVIPIGANGAGEADAVIERGFSLAQLMSRISELWRTDDDSRSEAG